MKRYLADVLGGMFLILVSFIAGILVIAGAENAAFVPPRLESWNAWQIQPRYDAADDAVAVGDPEFSKMHCKVSGRSRICESPRYILVIKK